MATLAQPKERGANRTRFTDKSVAKMVAEATQRKEVGDPGTPGLSLRLGPGSRATWYLFYTVAGAGEDGKRGPQLRFKLGVYPLMELGEARTKAREGLDKAMLPAYRETSSVSVRGRVTHDLDAGLLGDAVARVFSERASTRPHHREQALRGAFFSAGLACMALDAALERLTFDEPSARYRALQDGVTYGDSGDNRVRSSVETVLSVISNGVNNGRAIARQASDALDEMFAGVRAEIIAEFFGKEQNATHLFPIARELEARAHARSRGDLVGLSVEAKAVLGVFADFVGAKRTGLLSADFAAPAPVPPPVAKQASQSEGSSGKPQNSASDVEMKGREEIPQAEQPKASEKENPKLL